MALHLVTGGAGFIGSHLATALVARGERVRVLDDLSSGRLENLAHLEVGAPASGAPVEFLQGDVADPRSCAAACDGVEWVFHEAAQVSVPRSVAEPHRSYEVNVIGTLALLEAARRAEVRRFVLAASSSAYGGSRELPHAETQAPDPLSPYASGKLAAEQLVRVWGRLHGMKTVALRYFNVFGPRQADDSPYSGVIALFARALLSGEVPTVYGDGEQTRDFTYVDNVVAANLLAAERELEPGVAINVGTGERVSVNELLAAMARLIGARAQSRSAEARPGDVRDSLASLERARTLLGYEPRVGWREGLATTVAWYRERSKTQSG